MLNTDPARRDDGLSAGPSWPHRPNSPKTGTSRTVLVVEDKPSVRALLVRMLASVECTVLTAASLPEALAIMRDTPPDVIVLDLRLLDSNEQATLDAVFAHRGRSHVIVVSAFLTTELIVRAMHLGARHVLDKPVSEEALVEAVQKALEPAPAIADPVQASDRERGAASHLVNLMLRALDADRDLKTLGAWARHVGLSETMLRQACYRAQMHQPHDARDFVRILVAVVRAEEHACDLSLLLDISDTRTLDPLLARAGLTGMTTDVNVETFLARQQFIPAGHEVLRLLRKALMFSIEVISSAVVMSGA